MHPHKQLRRCKVTKAPAGAATAPVGRGKSSTRSRQTASTIARRARSSSARRSSLQSGDILLLFPAFQKPQTTPLLYPVVHLAPELQVILHRGAYRTHYDQ